MVGLVASLSESSKGNRQKVKFANTGYLCKNHVKLKSNILGVAQWGELWAFLYFALSNEFFF